VICESPTKLNFPQPLGATPFVFKQFNAYFEVFHIFGHSLHLKLTTQGQPSKSVVLNLFKPRTIFEPI